MTDQRLLEFLSVAQAAPEGSSAQQQTLEQLTILLSRVPSPLEQSLLKHLLSARNAPPRSSPRRRSLTLLIQEIERSGLLSRLGKYRSYHSVPVFEDRYNECKQRTFMYLCENLHLYRPERAVMAWVNSTLNYKFLDLLEEYKRTGDLTDPQQLEALLPNAENQSKVQQDLLDFLQADPEGLLASYSIRYHPQLTFQYLALARTRGVTWRQLEEQTQVSIKTLSCFFNRKLQILLPYFRKYL